MRCETTDLQIRPPKAMPLRRAIRLFIFIFTTLFSALNAAGFSEEYGALLNWELPENAIDFAELEMQEELLFHEEKAFSGWAFELYDGGELQSAAEYQDGKLHGAKYVWYPENLPQMSAFYRHGIPEGRFLGWYLSGHVLYDLYLKRGTFGGDFLLEDDDSRTREESEIYEGEGRDNDDSHD